jgi:putative phage-type endonuclease
MYRRIELPNGNSFLARTTWKVERALSLQTPEQRSAEWLEARRDKLTGSIIDTIIGNNPYQSAESVLLVKAGKPDIFTGNQATAHGTLYEPEAIEKYSARYNRVVLGCGLIPHPTHPLLAHSPDGLSFASDGVGEPVLLEVKCPLTRKIKPGVVPEYYKGQVQMGMDLFGLPACHFVQYRPANQEKNEPEILDMVEIRADPKWLERHDSTFRSFWAEVEYWRGVGWRNHPAAIAQECLIPG